MFRRLFLAGAFSLLAAGAMAAVMIQSTATPAATAPTPESPTAEAFATALVDGINQVLSDFEGDDYVALQALLEGSIESVFLNSSVAPEAALDGVGKARVTLTETGVMCDLPENGVATKRCEAVALAFLLAQKAAEAAQAEATGALNNGRAGSLAVVPSVGSGGAGGGVTHPPVSI